MRENTDQKNSVFAQFLCSEEFSWELVTFCSINRTEMLTVPFFRRILKVYEKYNLKK